MYGTLDMERNPDVNLITKFETCAKDTEILTQYEDMCAK
jgi:hypothetical protein